MTLRRKFENCLLALILSAGLASSSVAQRQDHNGSRPRQESRPAARAPRSAGPRAQNSAPREQRREQPRQQAPAYSNRAARNADRPSSDRPFANRPNSDRPAFDRQTVNPNRPPSSQYSRGAENNAGVYRGNQQYRLSPEERQRVIQNQQRFRQLSPQQQQDMRARSRVWQQMTPQQRDHIRNEVLPTWRNLPPGRQKAIEQRLGVLQNMPESARNRHLSDPNFTRGMSDEDRATLQDLSHLHVGGAPDAPNE
jgi:hypothetical protein